MPGGDIHHMDWHVLRLQAPRRQRDDLFQILLANTNAAPANGIEIIAIHEAPHGATTARVVFVNVIERAARIKTRLAP